MLVGNNDICKSYEQDNKEPNVMHSIRSYEDGLIIKSIGQAKTGEYEWWREMTEDGE